MISSHHYPALIALIEPMMSDLSNQQPVGIDQGSPGLVSRCIKPIFSLHLLVARCIKPSSPIFPHSAQIDAGVAGEHTLQRSLRAPRPPVSAHVLHLR